MRISDWSSDVCSSDLIAARHMPERAVLQLACAADDSSLAEAGDTLRVSAQHVDEALRKIQPQRLQLLHIGLKHVDVAPGKGIGDHRGNAADQQRPRLRRATLVEYLLDGGLNLSHLNGQVVLLQAGRLLGSRIVCRDRATGAIFSLSLSGLPRGPLPPRARSEIGRASCRERVCKYV